MPRRTRILVIALGGVAVVGAVAGLGALTSGGGGSGGSSGSSVSGRASGGDGTAGPGAVVGAPAVAPRGPVKGSTGGGSGTSTDIGLTVADIGTSKIRTVDMTVQVRHGVSVAAQANAAEAIASRAGGEVDADERSSGRYAEATLVLRVPPDQLVPALADLSRLGIEKTRHLATKDVTSAVADVNSRVASAQEAIDRLRLLYRQATKVADVITIESELSARESDLESLQAQQRALSAQTATATITLSLVSPPVLTKHVVPPPKKHETTGFLGGLREGWHAFAAGAAILATV
ncbi:MAG TPA: DUF4349 domain-containing protein, partial [Candidatus Nanopelagicales bacterium]|nr:DUF4349 domain-containing protein [Candidatus Nanopelagicales bacterium]